METRGWLSNCQAGFRKNRSCEDQVLNLTQKVSDGFQKKQMTVMALLDYSKAYDRVWREDLLLTMLDKAIKAYPTKW